VLARRSWSFLLSVACRNIDVRKKIRGLGQRARLCKGYSFVNFLAIRSFDGVEFCGCEQMLIEHLLTETADAIAVARGLLFLARALTRSIVSLMRIVIAISHAPDHTRPLP